MSIGAQRGSDGGNAGAMQLGRGQGGRKRSASRTGPPGTSPGCAGSKGGRRRPAATCPVRRDCDLPGL
eukprot:4998757-Pyramimonas_sp.AAC.1